ncbi:MAG TPA: glycosyltransferase [bacterium]|nr:glycosyltransferase [bacterium]
MREFLFYAYILLLFMLSVFGLHRYYMVWLYRKNINRRPEPKHCFRDLPPVTIQLPIFNEKYVAERLIEAVAAIRYPSDRLEIQVLDDSTDETTLIAERKCGEVRGRGIDIRYIHRDDRTGFKAGALENGLRTARGEYVAVFDADFLPDPDFLERTIHHFTDPGIGMVQARWDHLNRGWSLLTESQSILLDGHFMIEHTARNRSGRFFNFNGTAGIWRKTTIADAGGWQHDTLTEDLDLSYRAQIRGWRFVYLPDITVPAELPVEMSSFKSQQFRWAKGSIQVFLKLYPSILRSALPAKVKMEAFFHLGANFAYLLMTLFCVLLPLNILLRHRHGIREVIFFDLPVFLLATISVLFFYFYSEMAVIRSTAHVVHASKLRLLFYLPATMAVGIGLTANNACAVIEALIRKTSPFVRTPKYDITGSGRGNGRLAKVLANAYRSKTINGVALIEALFAVYFTIGIHAAFLAGFWFSIPFLLLFQFGFLYTAVMTLLGEPIAALLRRLNPTP